MGLTCEIKFDDNPLGIFFAGHTINGKFELSLDKLTLIKSIRLIVRGFSKVEWSKDYGADEKHYKSHENYLDSSTPILDSGDEPVSIPIGTQTYPFTFELSKLLPSSFEGKYGHVRYQVSVIVECPLEADHISIGNIAIINKYDLNTIVTSLESQYEKENIQNFCCGPCASGNLKIKINMPRTAFIPGEFIPVKILLINDTSVHIYKINLYLIKRITYRTFAGKENKEIINLCKETLKGISIYTRKEYNTDFIISALTPSNLGSCKLITMEYEIMVRFVTSLAHWDIDIVIPINIGTTAYNTDDNLPITTQPLIGSTSQPPTIGFIYQQPEESSLTRFQNANIEPSAPPPGYEETVYGKNINQN